jgi:hypothetical protein
VQRKWLDLKILQHSKNYGEKLGPKPGTSSTDVTAVEMATQLNER